MPLACVFKCLIQIMSVRNKYFFPNVNPMKLMYLIYSWTNSKAGREFIDCICFPLYFQTPFISCLFLVLCSWLCKLHKICDLCMALDSYFMQEVGLNKPLRLNFLERNSRTLAWFSSCFLLLFFRLHRQCQRHH